MAFFGILFIVFSIKDDASDFASESLKFNAYEHHMVSHSSHTAERSTQPVNLNRGFLRIYRGKQTLTREGGIYFLETNCK